MKIKPLSVVASATLGIVLCGASMLVPWFAFQRDRDLPLIVEPAPGYTASGHTEKRPWWGSLPPEGGVCHHLLAHLTVTYHSRLSGVEVTLVRWSERTAAAFTILDILAWAGLLGWWLVRRRTRWWAMLLSAFACSLATLFVIYQAGLSAVGNACLGGIHPLELETVTLQRVSLLPAGPLLLALGTAFEAVAIVLFIQIWRRTKSSSQSR
jgi:hypothetical protein